MLVTKKYCLVLTLWKYMTIEPWQSPTPETDQSRCWQCRLWWKWHPAFGSCLDPKCTPGTWKSAEYMCVCLLLSNSVIQLYIYCCKAVLKLSVNRPVEQPGLLRAGQSIAEFVSFNSIRIVKLCPGKIPLFSTTCCNGVTIHSGTQVGVDPEEWEHL